MNLETINRGLSLLRRVNYNRSSTLGPVHIEICTTSFCNHNCYFCLKHSRFVDGFGPSELMDDEMLWRLLEDIKKLNVQEVLLGGDGEPTSDPRIVDIIKFFDDSNIKVKLITNGSLLNKVPREVLERLYSVTISINGVNEENHRIVHSYKGKSQLQKVLKNIEEMLLSSKLKNKTRINYVVTSDNVSEFDDVIKFARRYDLVTRIRPMYVGHKNIKLKQVSAKDINSICEKVLNYSLEKNLSKNMKETLGYLKESFSSDVYNKRDNLLPCFAGIYGAYINSNGDYRISVHCGETPFGNIKEKGLLDLWKSEKLKSTLNSACIMNKTGNNPFKNCSNCLEVEAYSSKFYKILKKIPFQLDRLQKIKL